MHRFCLLSCLVTAAVALPLGASPGAPAEPRPKPSFQEEAAASADSPAVRQGLALLEVWLEAERAYDRIPGISAGIVHDQELVWAEGFGVADRETGRSATPETIYSICSISKLFTSVAVMQQRDAGRLGLRDPVSEHLPDYDLESTYPESGPVRIEGLLTHSAGLPRESAHPYWTGPEFPFPSREEIVAALETQDTLYPADETFQYSNLGLTLAGQIVEEGSGQPYGSWVQARILDPLQMASTTPEIPVGSERLAVGYGRVTRTGPREALPRFQARGIAPAAGFASTVEDLARFASWQFRVLEGDPEATDVLARNTLREMHRVHWVEPDFSTHRGLGFGVWRWGDRTVVGHGGSCPGFRSQLAIDPERRVATIAMANAMGVNPSLYARRAYEIFTAALGQGDDPGWSSPPEELERYTGLYESAWGEQAIVLWEDGLASVPLPTDDPLARLTELEHVGGNVFRRIRDDGDLGEEWTFIVDDEGTVIRLESHGNYREKVR